MNAFIACTKEKSDSRNPAEKMYLPSSLFRKCLTYAKKVLKADNIYILSAKHHLLKLSEKIDPYNVFIRDFSEEEKKEWSEKVLEKMKEYGIDFDEKAVFLAGEDYCKYLIPEFKNCECPFGVGRIGDILHWLDNQNKDVEEITEMLSSVMLRTISLSEYLKK